MEENLRYGFYEDGRRREGGYFYYEPVPDHTQCACCNKLITMEPGQIRENYLTGCNCVVPPYVCSICRHRNNGSTIKIRCMFCQKLGTAKSFKPRLKQSETRVWACKWIGCRIKHHHVKSHLCQMVLKNWNLCYHYHQTVSYENYSPVWDVRVLKEQFFKSWFRAQLFQPTRISICYIRTIVNSRILRILKNVHFARLFIRNFFGGFHQTCQPKRFMAAIHQRLMANVKALFTISLEL